MGRHWAGEEGAVGAAAQRRARPAAAAIDAAIRARRPVRSRISPWRPAREGRRGPSTPAPTPTPPPPPPPPPPALALIPDDDDLELVSKARANRASRLAVERAEEVAFTAGARGSPLAGAQAAVYILQAAGAALDAGDGAAAAAALGEAGWVAAFEASAAKVAGGARAAEAARAAGTALAALAAAPAKPVYVAAARAVAGWAAEAGVAEALAGL